MFALAPPSFMRLQRLSPPNPPPPLQRNPPTPHTHNPTPNATLILTQYRQNYAYPRCLKNSSLLASFSCSPPPHFVSCVFNGYHHEIHLMPCWSHTIPKANAKSKLKLFKHKKHKIGVWKSIEPTSHSKYQKKPKSKFSAKSQKQRNLKCMYSTHVPNNR
jgi:hypothetical protein